MEIKCLDHGFVRLIDMMPSKGSPDTDIVNAARVSYAGESQGGQKDEDLIRYLYRNRHTTPFEMVEFKFHCRMPLFVQAQWVRHRTASINQVSARYKSLPSDFYFPEEVRGQSKDNKQGSFGTIEDSTFLDDLENNCAKAYADYERAIASGVALELARTILQTNIYTMWYWKIDLHNLLHFLSLRCDHHAQYEMRVYANAILELIRPHVPITIQAWIDYRFEALTLSRPEVEVIKELLRGMAVPDVPGHSKTERKEWIAKCQRLGFNTDGS